MVFFNCNACGEALKKNQVEKHYQQKCRRCEVLSCVDCQKEFWGDAYKEHTKCVSEEEKYSGKNWKPKANANKGEQKQEAWTQQVLSAIASCPSAKPQLKQLLQRIQDCPNIPRKQAKFENFVKNSMRVRESYLITEAWNIISAAANKNSEQSAASPEQNGTSHETTDAQTDGKETSETNGEERKLSKRQRKEERQKKQQKPDKKRRKAEVSEAGEGDNEQKSNKHKNGKKRSREEEQDDETEKVMLEEEPKRKKKKKKQKTDEEEVEIEAEPSEGTDARLTLEPREKFDWEQAILEILQKSSDHEISLKKMKKKVLAEFHSCGGDGKTYTDDKLMSRLTKHIFRNPRLKVRKERVKLLP